MMPARVWMSRRAIFCAWFVLAVIALHPPGGLGLPLCASRALTARPCPGCGLLRSCSHAIRLDAAAAVRYHPFGPLFVLLLLAQVIVSAVPSLRRHACEWLHHRQRAANGLYWTMVASFVLYGVARMAQ